MIVDFTGSAKVEEDDIIVCIVDIGPMAVVLLTEGKYSTENEAMHIQGTIPCHGTGNEAVIRTELDHHRRIRCLRRKWW